MQFKLVLLKGQVYPWARVLEGVMRLNLYTYIHTLSKLQVKRALIVTTGVLRGASDFGCFLRILMALSLFSSISYNGSSKLLIIIFTFITYLLIAQPAEGPT